MAKQIILQVGRLTYGTLVTNDVLRDQHGAETAAITDDERRLILLCGSLDPKDRVDHWIAIAADLLADNEDADQADDVAMLDCRTRAAHQLHRQGYEQALGELEPRPIPPLVAKPRVPMYDEHAREIIRKMFPKLTPSQFDIAEHLWLTLGRDPRGGDFHPTVEQFRDGPQVKLIMHIDVARDVALETGLHGGAEPPEYEYNESGFPVTCRKKIYRLLDKDDPTRRVAFIGIAHFDDCWGMDTAFVPKFVLQSPKVCLARRAEKDALNQAFPRVMRNIIIDEEKLASKRRPKMQPAGR